MGTNWVYTALLFHETTRKCSKTLIHIRRPPHQVIQQRWHPGNSVVQQEPSRMAQLLMQQMSNVNIFQRLVSVQSRSDCQILDWRVEFVILCHIWRHSIGVCDWSGLKIMLIGHRRIGIKFSFQMSQNLSCLGLMAISGAEGGQGRSIWIATWSRQLSTGVEM